MYRNSMFLVCVPMAISRCRLRIRQALIIAFMLISWRHEQMELFSALGGMLLAHLHQQGPSTESTPCPSLDLEKEPSAFVGFEKGSIVSISRTSQAFITQCIYIITCGIGVCLVKSATLGQPSQSFATCRRYSSCLGCGHVVLH